MSGNIASLQVELNLDDGGFTGKLVTATGTVKSFGAAVNTAGGQLGSAEEKVRSFSTAVAEFTIIGLGVEKVLEGIKYALIDLPEKIVSATSELQRMQVQFQGLSDQLTEQGRENQAAKWIEQIYTMAEKTPFTLNGLRDSFLKLRSVNLDPMAGSLQAITDAISRFGGNDDTLSHATLAIMEMAGRGVVSLEQLRRQLGKAIPTAIQDMAYSMDMTYGELMHAVQKGTLESTVALDKMLEEMKIVYAGQGLAHMHNFIGEMAVFKTEWMKLAQDVGNAGFMEAVQHQLQTVIDLMKSPVIHQFGQQYGQALGTMVNELAGFVQKVIEFHNEIQRVGEVIIAVFAANAVRAAIATFTASLTNLASVVRGTLTTAMQTYYSAAASALTATQYWNAGGMQAAQTVGVLAAGLRGLGLAFLNVIPVAGQLIIILYSLAEATGLFTNKANQAAADIENGIITEKAVTVVKDRVSKIKGDLKSLHDNPLKIGDPGGSGFEVIDSASTNVAISALEAELDRYNKALDKGESELKNRAASGLQTAADSELENVSADIRSKYMEVREEIRKNEAQPGSDRTQLREQRITNVRTYYDQLDVLYQQYLTRSQAMMNSEDQAQQEAGKRLKAEMLEKINTLRDARDHAIKIAEEAVALVPKESKGLSAIDQAILHLQQTTDEASAKMKGLGTETAKAMDAVSAGKFKEASQEQISKYLAVAAAADAANVKLKEWEKTTQANATATTEINAKWQESAEKLKLIQGQLNAGDLNPETAGLRTFEANLDHLKTKLTATGPELEAINAKIAQAVNNMREITLDSKLIELRNKTKQINDSLLDDVKQGRENELQQEIKRLQELVDRTAQSADQRKKSEDELQSYISARRAQVARENENGLQKMGREWANTGKQIEDVTAKWVNEAMTQIDSFVKTGKIDFASLAQSIIADIIKVQLQAMAAPLMKAGGDWLQGVLHSLGGGGGSLPGGGSDVGAIGVPGLVPGQHSGGIAGLEATFRRMVPTSLFDGAKRFHTGGFPGLGPNEIPTIINRGEGVFTPEQMKSLGGMGGMNVQINLINQSGTQMDSTASTPRFDGEQMVLDIVLRAASRPGSFRDNMKGAMSS